MWQSISKFGSTCIDYVLPEQDMGTSKSAKTVSSKPQHHSTSSHSSSRTGHQPDSSNGKRHRDREVPGTWPATVSSYPPTSPDPSQLDAPSIEVPKTDHSVVASSQKVTSSASNATRRDQPVISTSNSTRSMQPAPQDLWTAPAIQKVSSASDAANRLPTFASASIHSVQSSSEQAFPEVALKRAASPLAMEHTTSKRPAESTIVQSPAPARTRAHSIRGDTNNRHTPDYRARVSFLQQQNKSLTKQLDDTARHDADHVAALRKQESSVKILERELEHTKSELQNAARKANEASQTSSRQESAMKEQYRQLQVSFQNSRAEVERAITAWKAWESDAMKWRAEAQALNDMTTAQKAKIEAQALDIEHLGRKLEATTRKESQLEDLLSMRNTEAEATEKFLGAKDTMAEADVKAMVERLNSEIYNVSAIITDSLGLDDGTEESDELDATIQWELQAQFARICAKQVISGSDSADQNLFIDQVYSVICKDDPKLAGKWRAMTKRAAFKSNGRMSPSVEQALLQKLQKVAERSVLAHLPEPKPDLSSSKQALASVATLTCKLTKAVWEDVNSVDLRVYVVRKGEVFNTDTMIVDAREGTGGQNSLVKGTTDIGLTSSAVDGQGMKVLLKAQVTLQIVP